MNKTDLRQAHQNEQAWHCYKCKDVVLDVDMFIVGSGETGEAAVLHRACVVGLLETNVSSKLAERTVRRRKVRARREGYR